jgi:hypothetical protein
MNNCISYSPRASLAIVGHILTLNQNDFSNISEITVVLLQNIVGAG